MPALEANCASCHNPGEVGANHWTLETAGDAKAVSDGIGLVVQNGLKSGEQVIVDGVIRVRPGAPVRPVPMSPPPSTQTMPAAAANTDGARP